MVEQDGLCQGELKAVEGDFHVLSPIQRFRGTSQGSGQGKGDLTKTSNVASVVVAVAKELLELLNRGWLRK